MKRILLLSVAGIGLSVAGSFGLSVAHASMFEPLGQSPISVDAQTTREGVALRRVTASVTENKSELTVPLSIDEVLVPASVAVLGLHGEEVIPQDGAVDDQPVQVTQNAPASGSATYPSPPYPLGPNGEQALQSLWLLGVFR
ncbi:hypothetical protein EU803_09970 [Loktanella sp. IMCC34160]|uniref:hypothetical protein n=1 Tax=Loktanella sp. IMCC34160 TaxID=2510646 RepID=UPI00101D1F95|nr:hypothetical protein [Loktanella sp. IMCC34160]RYG91410.1 hypothetical protein EU803_09970 [Loktanella sp. IMCC34160]